MGNFSKYFLFFIFIKLSFSIVPLWNFTSSAIELMEGDMKEYDYYVTNNTLLGQNYYLSRKFYVKDGKLIKENHLYLDGVYYGKKNYSDLGSVYLFGNYYYVCPKGRYHVDKINIINNSSGIITDNVIDDKIDWDLQCFYQHEFKPNNKTGNQFLFIFYLGSDNHLLGYYLIEETFKKTLDIYEGIYAYRWRISGKDNDNTRKQMFAVVKNNGGIYLKDLDVIIGTNQEIGWQPNNGDIYLGKVKSNFVAYFNSDSYDFFWINYNINNITDFQSGYFHKTLSPNDKYNSISNFSNTYTQEKSPFEFFDNVTITEIKILHDNIAYYKLCNNDKNIYYYGLIDLFLNKVVFNTDKEINEFYPYSSDSLLAIVNESLYRICLIKNGNDCTETCTNKDPTYNPSDSNSCEDNCKTKLYLRPNDMCIEECDANLYYQINNDCYLCKDYKEENKKYKLINNTGCLPDKLKYSYFVNENLYLIACNEGFEYNENESKDSCLCKNRDYFIENNKCVPQCSNNYFSIGNQCEKCNDLCLTCENNADNCKTCEIGKYLDNNDSNMKTCKNCTNNCKTCEKGAEGNIECLSCYNDTYRLLFNKTCVDECPGNMTINDKNECIEIEEEEKEKEDNKDDKKDKKDKKDNSKDKYMLWIYAVVCGLFLFLIILCFYKRYCRSKNSHNNLIEDINTELIENNNIIN